MTFSIILIFRSIPWIGSSGSDMHPNAPKRGLRAAPGHNPIQTITMGFKIRRALRWFDELAGHGHYDGLKTCPAFTMDLENARQTITISLECARHQTRTV